MKGVLLFVAGLLVGANLVYFYMHRSPANDRAAVSATTEAALPPVPQVTPTAAQQPTSPAPAPAPVCGWASAWAPP